MQKSIKERVWAQIKSVVLLLAVFMLTISVTSAVYTFSPPSVSAPNGTYSVPLTTAKTAEWKWSFMSNTFNLSVNSQGKPGSSDPINGKYGATQDSRWKEAILSEKTLSFGDLLSMTSPYNILNNQLAGFFEANTRESGISGGRSWTVPAGLYDSQSIGYPTATYVDWHGWSRPDILGDANPASSDVLELFGTDTKTGDGQINVIKISQAGKFSPFPRFAIEQTDQPGDFDAIDPIALGGLRAGVVFADKGIIGLHVGPQPDESDAEDTDPALMAKISNHDTLNLEGHSNIGYGDTCQLFGKTAVTRGCPDGFYMVNYTDDCHAKCRQMYYTDTAPAEYVNGRCAATHGDMPDVPDYHTYPVNNTPITAAELQGCGTIINPPPPPPPGGTGEAKIYITPAGAVAAGAKWQLDGTGPLYNDGYVLTGISLGSHFIKYSTGVTGYTTPANSTITVLATTTATATGNYTAVAPPPSNTSLNLRISASTIPCPPYSSGSLYNARMYVQVNGQSLGSFSVPTVAGSLCTSGLVWYDPAGNASVPGSVTNATVEVYFEHNNTGNLVYGLDTNLNSTSSTSYNSTSKIHTFSNINISSGLNFQWSI